MSALAKTMELVFIAAWFVGIGGLIYASRYWLPMAAAGFRRHDKHKGYMRKAVIGYGIFSLALAVGFAAAGIAEYWGGGWR